MTKKRDDKPGEPRDLRRRAEERMRTGEPPAAPPAAVDADAAKLVHELQVHQIELELQNEELRRSRAEAEAALALYAELYESAPVGYFTLGPGDALRRVNLAGARLLGAEPAALVGRRLGGLLASDAMPAFDAALAAASRREEVAPCEVQLAPATAEGAEAAWVQLAFSGAADGEVRVAAVDVSERRRAEALLRSAQKMEAVGRLAGGVAHDFNNLLTIVLVRADAALVAADRGQPPQEELGQVIDAARRAAALTKKLLAFGRKQRLHPEVVDLAALTRGLERLLRTLVGERTTLELDLEAAPAFAEVDAVEMEQVIVNLAVNARDAMPDGGRMTVATRSVNVGGQGGPRVKPGAYVVLSVSDTGVGMDADTLAHVFEPFFSTKPRDKGTGLGLASVSGIVAQCGGEITVQSEPGRGTTFEIHLPRASPPPVAAAKPPPAPTVAGGTETILAVDDERSVLAAIQRSLAQAGYTVLVAGDGAEALRIAAQHEGTIHLLVTDVEMPGIRGTTLAARIGEARPATKILFISGYALDASRGGDAPPADAELLTKPFSMAELKARIRRLLDGA